MQYDENAEKYGYEGEMTPLKCDALKAYKGDVTIPVYGTIADAEVYLKDKADAAIAELKAALKESEEARYEAGADAADYYQENRRLKRALWLARVAQAHSKQYWGSYVEYVHLHENSFYQFINDDIFRRDNPNNDSFRMWSHRWRSVEIKCLKKAEEY